MFVSCKLCNFKCCKNNVYFIAEGRQIAKKINRKYKTYSYINHRQILQKRSQLKLKRE